MGRWVRRISYLILTLHGGIADPVITAVRQVVDEVRSRN